MEENTKWVELLKGYNREGQAKIVETSEFLKRSEIIVDHLKGSISTILKTIEFLDPKIAEEIKENKRKLETLLE